jgi:hypothetical protein
LFEPPGGRRKNSDPRPGRIPRPGNLQDRVDIGDRLRNLNGLRIVDGTIDVMRMDVVRQLYGEDFWKMAVQDKDQDR